MAGFKPILIVEDDENDVTILQAAFADLHLQNPLHVVHEGEAAVRYLAGTGEYQNRARHPRPGLMLLDLQLPGMSGLAVLRWLGGHPEFKTDLRVVVVTSYAWPGTAQMVARLGADEFLEKPIGYARFKERLRGVFSRWQNPEP